MIVPYFIFRLQENFLSVILYTFGLRNPFKCTSATDKEHYYREKCNLAKEIAIKCFPSRNNHVVILSFERSTQTAIRYAQQCCHKALTPACGFPQNNI